MACRIPALRRILDCRRIFDLPFFMNELSRYLRVFCVRNPQGPTPSHRNTVGLKT